MKTVQINKVKVRIFEEQELKEKLGMSEKDIELIISYQRLFPELLQDDIEGFVIDANNLHGQLHIAKHLTQWLKPYIKEDNSYGFVEGVDFTRIDVGVNPTNGVSITGYKLTIEMAKQLCLVSKSEKGILCRNYFILMEKTLRNYERWIEVREPEKQNANKLKSELKKYAIRNFASYDESGLYAKEFNMINLNLTNCTALDIKLKLGYKDKNTRDHLNREINSAIDFLQEFDINLLTCNMNFDTRNNMINQICETKYSKLKDIFN